MVCIATADTAAPADAPVLLGKNELLAAVGAILAMPGTLIDVVQTTQGVAEDPCCTKLFTGALCCGTVIWSCYRCCVLAFNAASSALRAEDAKRMQNRNDDLVWFRK